MADYDLILRRGMVVRPEGPALLDLGVWGRKITAIEPDLSGSALADVDASNRWIYPGVIDPHVHLNEPGRADWEGIETGSRALAAGGCTSFFDMPLNSTPPVLDAAALEAKRALLEKKSRCDFAIWGGLTPRNLHELRPLAAAGAIGFKAFLSSSGTEDFPRTDTGTLLEGMKISAELGLVVAVHAENEAIVSHLAQQAISRGCVTMRDYLQSRPAVAEWEAIQRVVLLAGETGCAVHIVHVSTSRGARLIAEARQRGVNVTGETCPHYLILTDEDAERIGALAKCAPPLRPAADRDALWDHLRAGDLDWIASDHSPAPPEMKTGTDFFRIWGGISGAQHTFPLVLSESADQAQPIAPARLADLFARNAARRFRLAARKGLIEIGQDADLVVVDPDAHEIITNESLHYHHRQTPYLGRRLRAAITRTFLRGEVTYENGNFPGPPRGEMLRPLM
jgi:allantoinase